MAQRQATSRSFHADVWRRISHDLQDRGLVAGSSALTTTFVKTKAHTSRSKALAEGTGPSEVTLSRWEGNRRVDTASKQALPDLVVLADRPQKLVEQVGALRNRTSGILRAGAHMLAYWRGSLPPFVKAVAPIKAPREFATHQLVGNRRVGWTCTFCGVQARTAAIWSQLRHRACIGPVCFRASTTHALHYLAQHRVTWCARCGAWATRVPRRLLKPCLHAPRHTQ